VGNVAVADIESQSDSFTVGLDMDTGLNAWKIERPRKSNWTSPILLKNGAQELVVVVATAGAAAIDPAAGKVVWNYTNGGSSIPSGVVSGGVLFVPHGTGLTALQPGGPGEQPAQLWQSSQYHPGYASPIVVEGKVFTVNDAGIMACGSAATGERFWRLRMKGPFSATPVAVGHFIYCVNEAGLVQVVDITKPEGEVISEVQLGETILSTPAISRGAIYFRSDAHLWKFGKSAM
jgi:outer membrane protein assembly factor BamB